jgi:hypothetical protein
VRFRYIHRFAVHSCSEKALVEEEWVKVAAAPNETLALVMKGLLDEAGIPALVRRGSGFDVPDFLSAGPRDVLVPHLFAAEARELLEDTTGLGSWT